MLAYIVRRLLLTLPTLFLVCVAVFALVRFIPGDPAQLLLGDAADPHLLATLRQDLGLDQPMPAQFARWLGNVLRGDLGRSIITGEPVSALIWDRFQVSALIVVLAVAIASALSVAAGLIAAWQQNRALDWVISGVATLLLAMPAFWLGLLFLILFGIKLQWLPVVGYVPFSQDAGEALRYIILPVATLAIVETGVLTRMMRASAIEVLALEYVTHARAQGLPEGRILVRHVLPNAFAPTWTLIGLSLGHLLGGIAVLETVFTLPGLGRLLVDSIMGRDYAVVQGCLLFTATIYVIVNLIVDLFYPLFDPRVVVK